MADRNSIIDKIKALLAKTTVNGATEAEMLSALDKASAMMDAYDITDAVNLYAGVNNLFDEKPEFGYSSYPISAMGRYFYLGARVDFGAAVR